MGRFLVPDLGLAAAVVTLFYCLFLFNGVERLFQDADTGWHIRAGETILATAALPHADPYSFSRTGQSWMDWEWGSDLIMGVAHRRGGLGAVAWLYAAAISASVWLWFRLHWLVGGNFFLAGAMAAPMLSTINLHWLARPHVFGWLLLLAALWALETKWDRPLALPALFFAGAAVWANLHGSFFFAPLMALLYAAASFLRPLLWDLNPPAERRQAWLFLAAAVSASLGSLLNPYGWNLHRHVLGYLTNTELLARIGEFQSFNFHAPGAAWILITLGFAGAGGVLALGQRNLARFLLAAGLLTLALRSARGLPIAALALLPLANGAFTQALGKAGGLRSGLRRRLDGFLAYSERLRALDRQAGGLAWVPLCLLLAWLLVATPKVAARTGFPPTEFPVAASGAIEKLPPDIRLLAPDNFGGYLIYRFAGQRKVFFDGRSDFYGLEFMKRYIRLVQLRPGWQTDLDTYGFTHALLPSGSALAAALEGAGWKRRHGDATAVLLERQSGH